MTKTWVLHLGLEIAAGNVWSLRAYMWKPHLQLVLCFEVSHEIFVRPLQMGFLDSLELASISKSKRSLSSIVRLLSDNISSLWWWHMSVCHGQNFGDACKLLSCLCILCYFIPYINTNILKSSDSVLSNIIVSGPFLLIISVKNVSHLLTIVLMQD